MKIGPEEAARVAALAGLELDGDALETMAAELSKVLEYVDQLYELDARAGSLEKDETAVTLREDTPVQSLDRGLAEANAPSWEDGFFVVPRVIGGE